jgi:hypothetical protein
LRREFGSSFDDDAAGSFDDGDPYTTNLYVGNLAPDVDEEVMTLQTAEREQMHFKWSAFQME